MYADVYFPYTARYTATFQRRPKFYRIFRKKNRFCNNLGDCTFSTMSSFEFALINFMIIFLSILRMHFAAEGGKIANLIFNSGQWQRRHVLSRTIEFNSSETNNVQCNCAFFYDALTRYFIHNWAYVREMSDRCLPLVLLRQTSVQIITNAYIKYNRYAKRRLNNL